MLAKTSVQPYGGNNIELGTACGKYYSVGTPAFIDPGDSDTMRSLPEQTAEKEIMQKFFFNKTGQSLLKKKKCVWVGGVNK